AEDGIRDKLVTGVQTCALPILTRESPEAAQASSQIRLCSSARPRAALARAGANPPKSAQITQTACRSQQWNAFAWRSFCARSSRLFGKIEIHHLTAGVRERLEVKLRH